ncbi:MAG: fibronectin type III domain-containing protein [Clostridia bacterium]|nr:fibronectin type III domain-containing protein [Clostridia bacterium]
MFKYKNRLVLLIMTLTLAIVLSAGAGLLSYAVEDNLEVSTASEDFEASIADFPESYKPYLRELHEKYPDWVFEAFETDLEWDTVIDNQWGIKNLISDSAASENLKSKESGHYNQSTDKYIEKDGGFVVANRLAVEYYMDPRNFLNEEGIFQFEKLTFSDAVTMEDVESVLKGTFMYDTKITYYTAEGEKEKSSKTYAQVIFEAGQENNVNPCYLASKIRNEVGADGSASVSGTHSVYPGIYNFYNIGATDGAGAITRGLEWASGGTTYKRPWTTPAKSIKGGAAYIVEKYIAKGQFTGYLQKFNVNKATGSLYTHQYMTNLTGACSQGYTSYTAYAKTGNLYQTYIFSIPVYKNMPSEDMTSQKASNADSLVQNAIIQQSSCYVRTGPSTNNAQLSDKSGNIIRLTSGHEVKILSKTFTDSKYYINQLKYPHWVEIKFTYNSKSYTGYVPEDFVTYTSYTSVGIGEHEIGWFAGNETEMALVSSNSAIAKVTSKNTVSFLKSGTVHLTAYDSVGRYDIVKYIVSDEEVAKPQNLRLSSDDTNIRITCDEMIGAEKYAFGICDEKGNIIANTSSASPSAVFSGLRKGQRYTVSVRALLDKSVVSVYSPSAVIHSATDGVSHTPDKITLFKAEAVGSDVRFSWDEVSYCTGYIIYGYNVAEGEYVEIADALEGCSYTLIDKYSLDFDRYYIRAYSDEGGSVVYGEYSDAVTLAEAPEIPANLGVVEVGSDSYTLVWEKSPGADSYEIYTMAGKNATFLATSKTNSFTVTDLEAGEEKTYAVAAVKGGCVSETSVPVNAMTLPETVTSFKCDSIGVNEVKLSWADAQGASYYNIYIVSGKENILVGETEDVVYTLGDLGEFTDYEIKVAAVAEGVYLTQTGNFSKSVKITTALGTVEDLTVDYVKGNSVTLSWQENEGADKYAVYVYSDTKKKYVEKLVTEDSQATVTVQYYNKHYTFAVKAVGVKNGKTVYSDFSESAGAMTDYPVPENIKVTDVKSASYKLSWTKIADAVSYNVYRLNDDGYELVATVDNNSYHIGGLDYGQIDTYKITAVYKSGTQKYESAYSSEVIAATTPAKVKDFTATAYTQTVKFTWSAVENADSYNIYLLEDGQYVLVGTSTGTSHKVTGLSEGSEYEFYIRAYIKLSSSTVKGSMTSVSAVTKPAKPEKMSVSSVKTTSHKLSWNQTPGANYYYVYRYSSSSKKYEIIGKTESLSYTVTGLSAGKTYSYKVKGVYMKNGKEIAAGTASSAFKFATNPVQVTSLKASSVASKSFKLSWKKTTGATYYEVAIYSSSKGKYVIYNTTDTNSITFTNRKAATTYKVKVRAVRVVGEDVYYGAYSAVLSVKTK